MREARYSKGKTIRPTFFVFCEGKTEEKYIRYLRSYYRLPIEINAKIAGNRITSKYIMNYKKKWDSHANDKTFLIYDGDIEEISCKLEEIKREIKNIIVLLSIPCFELWFLLHFSEQRADLTSVECIAHLKKNIENYQKGHLDEKLKAHLSEYQSDAIARAKSLLTSANPSTSVYKLIEELNTLKT
jgi:hypothetical protein